MARSDNEQDRELECLDLALSLTRMGSATLSHDLATHCLRMACARADRADCEPPGNLTFRLFAAFP
jgi:hypothetical protein